MKMIKRYAGILMMLTLLVGFTSCESEEETEFNLLKEVDGSEVMVQGIIDCYFEEEDQLILIDYKNSYIDPAKKESALERLKTTYAGQIEIYKEARETIRKKPVAGAYLYLFSENAFFEME